MRLFLILCLCALPLAAEEPMETALVSLRSEDPAVRAEARRSLLARKPKDADAIRAFAAGEGDPEAKLAAQEISALLEYRSLRPELFAAEGVVYEGDLRALELKGPAVLAVLSGILVHSRDMVDDEDWEQERAGLRNRRHSDAGWQEDESDGASEAMDRRARCVLAALTLADCGENSGAWLKFIGEHQGAAGWSSVRLDALESRGFRIRSADANEAAEELLRALTDRTRSSRPSPDQVSCCSVAEVAALEMVTDRIVEGVPADGPTGISGFARAANWLMLNRNSFDWHEGRLRTRLVAEDYRKRLEDGDSQIRIAALWVLASRGWQIPATGWNIVRDAPQFAFEVMPPTGQPVPPDCLPYYLAESANEPGPPEAESLLDSLALRSLVEDPLTEPIVRWKALRRLLYRGERMSFSLAASGAGGGSYSTYPEPRMARVDCALGDTHAALPVFIDACLGGKAELERAETWLASAGPREEFLDVAIALASRGCRTGLYVIGIRSMIGLPQKLRAVVRSLVEGAPEGEQVAAWLAWGDMEVDAFDWDPVTRRWSQRR